MRANSEMMLQMSDVELTTSSFAGPAQNSGGVIQNTCDPEDPLPCAQRQQTASDVARESRGKTLQHEELKKSDANVKQLEDTAVSLRATQDSPRRTSALEEKRTQGLLEDNAHLEDSLAALQSQFQTSDIGGTRHRARVGLDAERQIPEHPGRKAACVRRESTNASRAVQKKVSPPGQLFFKPRHQEVVTAQMKAEATAETVSQEKALAMLFKETDDARAKTEGADGQHVHLIHAKDTPEADPAVCREERRACHSELATPEKELEKRRVDPDPLRWQLKEAREELKGARLQAEEHKEMAAIFKHKYTAAMEKVHRVQGQAKHLAEELQYSQRQLSQSRQATRVVAGELSELKRRHRDKVGQWESSQEALERLTDELHMAQNLLTGSQQTVARLRRLVRSLQGRVGALERQRVVLECDLRLYRQSRSHADEDYLSLQRNEQKLQGRCSEQAERLLECEKVILQMKSELERRNQEQGSPKQRLVTSRRARLSRRGRWEQEVARLKRELAHLERELAESPKKLKGPHRANPSLSTEVRQPSQELEALRRKHRTTVEVLAARSKEEAKRVAACRAEEEQDDRRDADGRLQVEVAELKRTLQRAQMEKKHARAQVDTLQSKLAASCSENGKLRHESQLIVTDLKRWITEQRHLCEKNDTLKAEVARLKDVAAGQEKEMGSIKAQLKEFCALQDEKILDKQTCVALRLGGLADMQTKLQRSLVNQQLNALREENKHLRRQLEEERGTCTQVPPPSPSLPVPTQHCFSSPSVLPPCSSSSSSQPETSDKGHRRDRKPKLSHVEQS